MSVRLAFPRATDWVDALVEAGIPRTAPKASAAEIERSLGAQPG